MYSNSGKRGSRVKEEKLPPLDLSSRNASTAGRGSHLSTANRSGDFNGTGTFTGSAAGGSAAARHPPPSAESTYASRARSQPTHQFETLEQKRRRRAERDHNRRVAKMGRRSVMQTSADRSAAQTSRKSLSRTGSSALMPTTTYRDVLDVNEEVTAGEGRDQDVPATIDILNAQLAVCEANLSDTKKGTQAHDEWLLAYAITTGNLGCLYKNAGRNDDALTYLRHAMAAEEDVLGRPSCSTMLNLSAAMLSAGEAAEALPIAEACVDASAEADPFLRVTALHNLAVIQGAQERAPTQEDQQQQQQEALNTMQDALQTAREELGADHPTTQMIGAKLDNPRSWLVPSSRKPRSRSINLDDEAGAPQHQRQEQQQSGSTKSARQGPRYLHLPPLDPSYQRGDVMNQTAPVGRRSLLDGGDSNNPRRYSNNNNNPNDSGFDAYDYQTERSRMASTMPVGNRAVAAATADRQSAKEAVLSMNFDTPKKMWFKRRAEEEAERQQQQQQQQTPPAKFNPEKPRGTSVRGSMVAPPPGHYSDLPLRRTTTVDPTLRRTTTVDPTLRRTTVTDPTLRDEEWVEPSLRRTTITHPRLVGAEEVPARELTEEQRYAREHHGAPSFTRFAPEGKPYDPDRLSYRETRARLLGEDPAAAPTDGTAVNESDILHDPSSRSAFQSPNRELIRRLEQEDEEAYLEAKRREAEAAAERGAFDAALQRIENRTRDRAARRIQAQWRPWWEQNGAARREVRGRDGTGATAGADATGASRNQARGAAGAASSEAAAYPRSVRWCANRWLEKTTCLRYLARNGVPHDGRSEEQMRRGITQCQAAWRGTRSREETRRRLFGEEAQRAARQSEEERQYAASLIQAQARGAAARDSYAAYQHEQGAPARAAAAEREAAAAADQQRNAAATSIQRAWRGHQDYMDTLMSFIQQSVSRVRRQEYESALELQRVGRGAADRAASRERQKIIEQTRRELEEDQRLFERQKREWSTEPPEPERGGGVEEQLPSMESVVAPLHTQPMSEPERAAYARYVNTRPTQLTKARAQEDWYTETEAQTALGDRAATKIQRAYRSWDKHRRDPKRDRELLDSSRAAYRAKERAHRRELDERARLQARLPAGTSPAHDMRSQLQEEVERLEAEQPRAVPIRDPLQRYADEENIQRREKLLAGGPAFLREY